MTTEAASRSPELPELLQMAVEYNLRDVHVALPGKIDSYDPETQKANVKPLVKRLTATGDGKELLEILPIIPGVPVVFPRGGNGYISMPVKKDDFCLLVFNSFPVDKYKAGTGKDTNPEDFEMHDLSDAVALMGFAPFSKAIVDADPDNIVVGFEEGVQAHIATDKIELGQKDAPEQVSIDSKVQTELNRLRSDLDSLATIYNVHTHVTTVPASGLLDSEALPVTGTATGSAAPPGNAPVIQTIDATNSELVTIKE